MGKSTILFTVFSNWNFIMACVINFTYLSVICMYGWTCSYMNHSCTHTHTHMYINVPNWPYSIDSMERGEGGREGRNGGQNYQQIVDRFHLICALNCSATRFVRVINVQITFRPTDWRTDVAKMTGGGKEGAAGKGGGQWQLTATAI